ncbi:hypothetical protein C9374_000533 [Naegleria lovaniensis]|uniref:Peptidase S59 domain-containing protein n=1 Tax=Naegleria lovaniensis TaxID=51637 RepID=A0AA88GZ67_NAELO|nr:uncharacterized protein C9374_000533 [Naegleria lovaniensis]KAG2388369.1 hypothetical protein C9374_000533 [Naegleria lovaniensis]
MFNFGNTQPSTGGFGSTTGGFGAGGFGGSQPSTNTTGNTFSFGQSGGGGFGGSQPTNTFGSNTTGGGQPATGFGFGTGNTFGTQFKPTTTTFGSSTTNTGFNLMGSQNAQPNTSTNTFGATGSTPFGTSSNMFGSSGATTTGTTSSTGFGFGGTQPTTSGFPSTFGSSTGTGFGATTGGTTTTTGSGFTFGQPGNTTAGGSIFPTTSTNTGGMGSMGFGGMSGGGMGQGQTNTSIFPAFKPVEENGTSGKMVYYSLTKMEPYKDKSFEEWRWYYTLASQGKLTSSPFSQPTTTTTGMSTGFGQPTTGTSSSFSFGNTASQPTSAFSANTGFNRPATTGFGFGTSNTGQTGTTFGTTGTGFGTTGGTTNTFGTTGTTNFGFNKPATTGTTGGFNFGSGTGGTTSTGFGTATQPSTGFGTSTTGTTGGFNFGGGASTGTTGFGTSNTGTTGGFNFGATSTTAPASTGFNFGGAPGGTATAGTGSTGFNFGAQPSQPAGTTSGFNFGTGTTSGFGGSTLGGAPSTGGFNFGAGTTAGGTGFNFGAGTTAPTSAGFNFSQPGGSFGATMTGGANFGPAINVEVPTVLSDPYGPNSLYQFLKESGASELKEFEEETSVISKSVQKTSAQIRPRTFKKSGINTMADRLALISTEGEPNKPFEDLLDSSSFTSKENVKSLTISPKVFEGKRVQNQPEQRVSKAPSEIQQDTQNLANANIVKPKPQKGKVISIDIEPVQTNEIEKPHYLPTLTKEGFYTVPSMEDMKKMTLTELQGIRDFVVGRKGYGELKFLGFTDVTKNLDLDKIIFEIEKNHVDVYSEHVYTEGEKPPVGTELNKPTIITLFDVHPKNNDYKSFERRLRKVCENNGSKFLSYSSGQWTFSVEHFTKYGLGEEEEIEEIEEEQENNDTKQDLVRISKIVAEEDEEVEDDNYTDFLRNDEMIDITTHKNFLPRQLNLDPRRMYLMQSNLMDENEDTDIYTIENTRKSKKTRFVGTSTQEPFQSLTFSTEIPSIQPTRQKKSVIPVPSNIKGDKESESDPEDMLSALRRSFRVGFLPNGQFIVPHSVFNPKSNVSNLSISNTIVKEDYNVAENQREEFYRLKYETYLDLVIENCYREDISIRLKGEYSTVMENYIRRIEAMVNHIDSLNISPQVKDITRSRGSFELSVWRLIHILFSQINMGDNNEYADDIARKRNLSAWIRDQMPIEDIIRNENPSPLRKIYLYLTCGRIPEAAKVALENKDLRLSAIISQCFSNPMIQKDIEKQITLWNQTKANIDVERKKIYELLAGHVTDTSLQWLQCLGLHLWFKCSPDQSICDVLQSYTSYFETARSTRPLLLTKYHSSSIHHDVRFNLIKIYCESKRQVPLEISKYLKPYTYCNDIMDCQLSWHMYNILRWVPLIGQSSNMAHKIHTNYALQLEKAGYWHHAIVILCHNETTSALSTDLLSSQSLDRENNTVSRIKKNKLLHSRDRAVRELLFRNYPSLLDRPNNIDFMKLTLGLPEIWIEEAAALFAEYGNSYPLLFEKLCRSNHFAKAHKILLDHIFPSLILCNRYDELLLYLGKLQPKVQEIPTWGQGGSILLNYVSIRKRFEELEKHVHGNTSLFSVVDNYDHISTLDSDAVNFLEQVAILSSQYSEQLEHRVAISDMTVCITNFIVKTKSFMAVFETDEKLREARTITIEHPNQQRFECLEAVHSINTDIYLPNRIDLLQTIALSNTFPFD